MSINSNFSGAINNYDILKLINKPTNTEHQHPLVFCFTPQRIIKGDFWTCNKCSLRHPYDIPSFYCTFCDYYLCQNCLGKYKLNQVKINKKNYNEEQGANVFKWQQKFDEHKHLLTFILKRNKNFSWTCNKCAKEYKNNEPLFYCSLCDYDLCFKCMGTNKLVTYEDVENPSFLLSN